MTKTVLIAEKFQNGAGLSGYIAEMTSAFLCAHVGIENTRDSAAYLGSWMKHIKGDVAQQFMQAASQASKAMTFIIDRTTVQAEAA